MRGWAMLMVLALAGCGSKQATAPGGVSADEAAALNNAAEVLDASPDSLAAPPGNTPASTNGD